MLACSASNDRGFVASTMLETHGRNIKTCRILYPGDLIESCELVDFLYSCLTNRATDVGLFFNGFSIHISMKIPYSAGILQ